jgi:hypothetical protein
MKPERRNDRGGGKARRATSAGDAQAPATPDYWARLCARRCKYGNVARRKQIAVEGPDMGRQRRRPEFIGGALDDRSEDDFAPVVLEKIAQQGFERRLVHRQRKDVDG